MGGLLRQRVCVWGRRTVSCASIWVHTYIHQNRRILVLEPPTPELRDKIGHQHDTPPRNTMSNYKVLVWHLRRKVHPYMPKVQPVEGKKQLSWKNAHARTCALQHKTKKQATFSDGSLPGKWPIQQLSLRPKPMRSPTRNNLRLSIEARRTHFTIA